MNISKTTDLEVISRLYKEFLDELYGERSIATKAKCDRIVETWIEANVDIYVLFKDDEPIGLSMSYVDDNGGTLLPAYRAEVSYVKEGYRKSKKARDLFLLPVTLAKSVGIPVISKGSAYNGMNNRHAKLGGQLIFEERILYVTP